MKKGWRIPLANPSMDREVVRAVERTLAGDRLVHGEAVARFEEAFARYVGTDHAVAVNSGTHALHFTLDWFRRRGVRGAVTTPTTFAATAIAALHAGLKVSFADITRESPLLPGAAARRAPKTSLLLPVHLHGHPVSRAFFEAAEERDVPVVEDACQAHGALLGRKKAGSLGAAGCFSFYPTKNMTVGGDGGMVTTDDEALARHVRTLRDVGRLGGLSHRLPGYTARLNSINAAIGLVQLRRLDDWNRRRRALAARYHRGLKSLAEGGALERPSIGGRGETPVFHHYAICLDDRDEVKARLAKLGIETGIHYPTPVPLEPCFRETGRWRAYPEASRYAARTLSLPLFPGLRDRQVDEVCDALGGLVRTGARALGIRTRL